MPALSAEPQVLPLPKFPLVGVVLFHCGKWLLGPFTGHLTPISPLPLSAAVNTTANQVLGNHPPCLVGSQTELPHLVSVALPEDRSGHINVRISIQQSRTSAVPDPAGTRANSGF